MKFARAALLLLVSFSTLHAAETSLQQARQRWLRGNYDEAREAFAELAQDPKQKTSATLGLSKTWQSVGEYDKALEVVVEALRGEAENADLLARQAEVHFLRGRWDQAEKAAGQALKGKPDQFLAHWVLAQLYRDRGDHA